MGGSAWSMTRDIADGFVAVTERTYKQLSVAQMNQLGHEIEQALGKLSEQDRSVLILREVQKRPYAEIAEMLALPLGTLKARLHRAREQLRKRLIRAGVTP